MSSVQRAARKAVCCTGAARFTRRTLPPSQLLFSGTVLHGAACVSQRRYLASAGSGTGSDGLSDRRGATAAPTAASATKRQHGGGLLSRVKELYHEFQVYQDRRLDAAAAEDSKAGLDAFYSDPQPVAAMHRSSTSRSKSPIIARNPDLCPRSVLFVPGSKPNALQKIPRLAADSYILDLEDSVGVGSKRQARENVRNFVEGLHQQYQASVHASTEAKLSEANTSSAVGGREGGMAAAGAGAAIYPRLIVRINSPDFDPATAMLDLELVGLLGPSIEGIAIPKTTTRSYQLIKDYMHPDHRLWAFFESPRSVLEAPAICRQRVYQCAVMGYNDLSAELQLPMATPTSAAEEATESLYVAAHLPLWQCTTQVLLAARASGVHVIDAVFNDPTDKFGFNRSLRECRSLGLNGKTLIHPSQIAPTNAAFTPTSEEVAWSTSIIEAVRKAEGGVATVDGKMVEDLHRRQASRVLALHESSEAERQHTKAAAAVAKKEGEGMREEKIGVAAGEAEAHREPRRTPSRHRPLDQ